jgi:hypothetical protein
LEITLKYIFFFSFIFCYSSPSLSDSYLKECVSVENRKIVHFDFEARKNGLNKRILVLGSIHGDEPETQELALLWLERLRKIRNPSNFWRIIPVVNPDGLENRTRYNSIKTDLNRNFPTKDWDQEALSYWRNRQQSDPRRYPGASAGSEIETKCVLKHLEDFKPDIVVSIHTPYGQFDFDGPANKKLKSHLLPWKRIGTFSGSLGRYLWDERGIPVLTIELRPDSLKKNSSGFLKLQDAISDLL